MDRMTKEQRHRCMVANRSKNTRPEILVRKFLWRRGFRYRVNVKAMPGSPDIVLRKYKTVIFVNGCFWHGHTECDSFKMPKSNVDFWCKKIERNKERDAEVRNKLKMQGWRTIVVWECELKKDKLENTLYEIEHRLDECLLSDVGAGNVVTATYNTEENISIAAEQEEHYGK